MGDLLTRVSWGMAYGDSRVERTRVANRADDLDRAEVRPAGGTPKQLVQVYDGGAMPTGNNKWFLTHPVSLSGTEVEGSTGTIAADSTSIPVVVLGSVPTVGDVLNAFMVGSKWVAELRGCSTTIEVVCGSTPIVGASVTVTSGMTTIATGTTGSDGKVTLAIGAAGSYTVAVTSGSGDSTVTITLACGATETVQVCFGCSCSPCDIPSTNITATFVNKGGSCAGSACQVVGGAYTLTFSGSCGGGQWLGTFDVIFEFPVGVFTPLTYSILLVCETGIISVGIYDNPTGSGSPVCFWTTTSAPPTSITCSPFMIEWSVTDPGVFCGCCIGSITFTP